MSSLPSRSIRYILGLDLGTTSIGWAVVEGDPKPKSIVGMGTRIFPEGMDRTKGEKSLNQDRRDGRALRRQGYRRVRRKEKLLHALQDIGLLPEDPVKLDSLFRYEKQTLTDNKDREPYSLRARALDEKLAPWQVGRALYHLGQRRGYLSNRKTGQDKEDGKVAVGIGELNQGMKDLNCRTLGEYFAKVDPRERRIRGRYTSRAQYQHEFDLIWDKQADFYPDIMDVANKHRIHKAIFDQRPLKIQKHLIGICEFEEGRKRAPRAALVAQEFRLWQTLNSIKVLFLNGEERYLTDRERATLYDKLATVRQLSWEKVKEALNFYDGDLINLEKMRKSGLLGNQTAAIVISCIGKKNWKALGEREREQLVYDLVNIDSDSALERRLYRKYRFEPEQIQKLIKKSLELPKGYLHLCSKAARNITRVLRKMATPEDRGLTYDQACTIAGYEHTKPLAEGSRAILPFPGKAAKDDKRKTYRHDPKTAISSVTVDGLRNPLVERALFQLRRTMNAIIKEYGTPEIIRVEMARDLKLNRKQREDYIRKQKQNEADNLKAEEKLKEYGYPNPTRADKIKYRLWEECGHTCPYTGKSINFDALFGEHPEFDIEHIIPYTRSLDDSYMNKTLCDKTFNAKQKGNQTPWEIFHGKDEYDDVKQRIKKLPYPKRKRFTLNDKELEKRDFVSQQLNETRYISRKAIEYLSQLDGVKVEPVKGGTTALLRRAWGLNNIFSQIGEKNRLDHRHHAIDALVCALTDRAAVQKLNRYAAISSGRLSIREYPEPFKDLRKQAEHILKETIVSHKPQRKIKGPLHEETLYSIKAPADEKGNPQIRIRKPLRALKPKDLDNIADESLKELAKYHLRKNGNDMKKAFDQTPTSFGFYSNRGGKQTFTPVNKVRLQYPLNVRAIGKDKRQRHVKLGSNHHIAIFKTEKNDKTKWIGNVVSTLDATQRLKDKQPVIEKNSDAGEFVMALHINDAVEMTHNGERDIFVLQKIAQSGQFHFRRHFDASEKKDMTLAVSKTAETLRKSNARKVSINMLGQIMPADD